MLQQHIPLPAVLEQLHAPLFYRHITKGPALLEAACRDKSHPSANSVLVEYVVEASATASACPDEAWRDVASDSQLL
jgi:hypothetical protein